jgi:hypothetical protein
VTTIRVGYRPFVPISAIVFGALVLLATILLFPGGVLFTAGMVAGMVGVVMGVLQLTTPYFDYDPARDTITISPGFGMKRQFGAAMGGRLHLAGDRIMCVLPDGRTRRVPVSATWANEQEWQAVLAVVSQRTAGGPATR